MLHTFNFQRDSKLFQSQTSQLTVKIAQDLIKRHLPIWTKLTQNYPLRLQDIPTEKAIFIATKDEKTNMVVIQNCIFIPITLNFLPEI